MSAAPVYPTEEPAEDPTEDSRDDRLATRARSGGDAEFPDWIDERAGSNAWASADFDSVVIRGSGVSALTCATRLARSPGLGERVVVAADRPTESPRLTNGCTLRARSLDYLAAATGESPERILDRLFGEHASKARTTRQSFSLFRKAGSAYEAVRMREFMPERGTALAYGLRNSRLVGALAELGDGVGLDWKSGTDGSLAACRAAAPGNSPFVINGSHLPLEGAPKSSPPSAFVVAWQCTMKRTRANTLTHDGSLIAGVRQPSGIDIGVFYPFADPLSPDADAYGLFYRIVHPKDGFSKEDAIAEMRETTLGVARAIGWEPVDEEITAAGAQVPGFAWHDVEAPEPDYFDLHRTFGAGLPIITGCGMARAGLAGWVTAESLIHGKSPAPFVNQSLHRWRRINRQFCWGMEDRTGLAAALLARFPAPLVGFLADRPHAWAGVPTS